MKLYKIIVCVLFSFLLVACTSLKDKENIITEVNKLNSVSSTNLDYSYQSNLLSWLSNESIYVYDKSLTEYSVKDLFAQNYHVSGDRLYFSVSEPNNTGTNVWTYVSLITGEKHYLCPDPLCEHTEDSGCPYVGLDKLIFSANNDSLIYTSKNVFTSEGMTSIIYEIDLSNNNITEKYREVLSDPDIAYNTFELLFIDEQNLYFTDSHVYKEIATEGKTIKNIETYLKSISVTEHVGNGEADIITKNFDTSNNCLYVIGEHILCVNQSEGELFIIDKNFYNPQVLYTFTDNENIYDIYYDTANSEIYFLISTYNLHNASTVDTNIENETSAIYKIDSSFNVEEISISSSQILDMQVTSDYIYYSIFDPISYGVSPRGIPTIDETGNKMYRVPRDGSTSPVEIFNGKGEVFISGEYIILGDYLYFDCYTLVKQSELAHFRRMGSTVRINLEKDTVRWFNFD